MLAIKKRCWSSIHFHKDMLTSQTHTLFLWSLQWVLYTWKAISDESRVSCLRALSRFACFAYCQWLWLSSFCFWGSCDLLFFFPNPFQMWNDMSWKVNPHFYLWFHEFGFSAAWQKLARCCEHIPAHLSDQACAKLSEAFCFCVTAGFNISHSHVLRRVSNSVAPDLDCLLMPAF